MEGGDGLKVGSLKDTYTALVSVNPPAVNNFLLHDSKLFVWL